MKRDLVGLGGENKNERWRVQTGGGHSSETGSMTEEKQKWMTSVDASLILDFRNKEESNNNVSTQCQMPITV